MARADLDRPEVGSTDAWGVRVLRTLEEVDSVRDEWAALLATALDPSPFVSFEWLTAWWASFAQPAWEMRCVVISEGGAARAIAPLYIARERYAGRSARVLRLWYDPSSNRINFLVSRSRAKPALRRLLDAILELPFADWDVAELSGLVLGESTTEHLLRALEERGVPHGIRQGIRSPYLPLPSRWADLDRTLGASFRKSLRRSVNRAKRAGLELRVHDTTDALDEVFAVSAETWQHVRGTGVGTTPALRRFYERVADAKAREGSLRLAFLYLDGRPIAFEYNLVEGGTVFNLKVGYRADHAHLSPGLVLRHHVLQHAIEQGMTEFDFLGDVEGYKLHWTQRLRSHASVFVVRRGLYWRAYHLVRYRLRALVETRARWLLVAKRRYLRSRSKAPPR